jgi:hypothetical protein
VEPHPGVRGSPINELPVITKYYHNQSKLSHVEPRSWCSKDHPCKVYLYHNLIYLDVTRYHKYTSITRICVNQNSNSSTLLCTQHLVTTKYFTVTHYHNASSEIDVVFFQEQIVFFSSIVGVYQLTSNVTTWAVAMECVNSWKIRCAIIEYL